MATQDGIHNWADEAQVGYDGAELKQRGRGRPGRGAKPMQVVAVRLTAEELDSLDAAAAESGMSRSQAIRAALTLTRHAGIAEGIYRSGEIDELRDEWDR